MDSTTSLTRRTFVATAAAVAASAASAGAAHASEPSQSLVADAVVIGSGTSGLIAATRAAELGAKVVLLEKLDEGQVGGCSRGFRAGHRLAT